MSLFTVTQKIDPNRVLGLVANAFDNSISYWATLEHYEFPIGNLTWLEDQAHWRSVSKRYLAPFVENGFVELGIRDAPEPESRRLDLAALKKGLQVMAEKHPKHWSNFLTHNDDAITADVFIQCCLFGEIVYS